MPLSTTLPLSILLLHSLFIQPITLLLLLIAHIRDPPRVATTRTSICNAASAVINLIPLFAWRLAGLLACLVDPCAAVVAVCGLSARCGLAVDGAGDGGEGL